MVAGLRGFVCLAATVCVACSSPLSLPPNLGCDAGCSVTPVAGAGTPVPEAAAGGSGADATCTNCGALGVGDPCSGLSAPCASGLTCSGGWCTEACTTSTQCAGVGPSGTNSQGEPLACAGTATFGTVCVPQCAVSASSCSAFPATTCATVLDVDGIEVPVCEAGSDASDN